MPQSLHQVYGHIVFSTKDRVPLIDGEVEGELFSFIGGIIRDLGGSLIEINGTADHIHLLVRAGKATTDTEFIRQVKGSSSKWMSSKGKKKFQWQAGYGWFSVSANDLEAARKYIQSQKEHHRKEGFQEEFVRFLKKYGVDYDERYLWD